MSLQKAGTTEREGGPGVDRGADSNLQAGQLSPVGPAHRRREGRVGTCVTLQTSAMIDLTAVHHRLAAEAVAVHGWVVQDHAQGIFIGLFGFISPPSAVRYYGRIN